MRNVDTMWIWLDRLASMTLIVGVGFVGWLTWSGASTPASTLLSAGSEAVQDINESTTVPSTTIRGNVESDVVLIEFTDFQCPFCGQHARDTYSVLREKFVDTGKLLYAVRNLPLMKLHPFALKAAEAAECAAEQGRYWEMHDRLFAHQDKLAIMDLTDHARDIALDIDRFSGCLDGEMTEKIRTDQSEAIRLKAFSTPTFFIGVRKMDGTVSLIKRINGAQPVAVFETALKDVSMKNETVLLR